MVVVVVVVVVVFVVVLVCCYFTILMKDVCHISSFLSKNFQSYFFLVTYIDRL